MSVAIFIATQSQLSAQPVTQIIKGEVVDKVMQVALPGANVVVLTVTPLNGSATDVNGKFKLTNIPVGKHSIKISFMGYKDYYINNLVVNSGKEVVLQIQLEEKIVQANEIVVVAEKKKNAVMNEMANVSARTFSVEETQKFAAAINDPARMAQAFAGVVSTDDGNNTISIRGNSPNGLLWRMEGVDIPNPNHFSSVATSGGGVSILSSQLLTNSDFLTGSFPAEYGNALSGVFDMRLRKGNSEKREHTIQAGFLGTDLATEGYFKKGYGGSYLVNYRYSTLSVLAKLGVPVGDAVTNFQDLSYNIFLPTKHAGNFSLFGFGGLSGQIFEAKKDSSKWKAEYEKYNWKFNSNTGAAGMNHTFSINEKMYLKTSATLSGSGKDFSTDRLSSEYQPVREWQEVYGENKFTIQTAMSTKFNAQHNIKSGVAANFYGFDLLKKTVDMPFGAINTKINNKGKLTIYNAYTQWAYNITENLQLNSGLHFMYTNLNGSKSIEPRANIKYTMGKQTLALGYGLHSQMQPLGIYFAETSINGNSILPNKNLDFTRAHHGVISYGIALTQYLHGKVEVYYQSIFNVPVATDVTSNFSVLNVDNEYPSYKLANKGLGKNYGTEFTLEQYMKNNLYFLLSGSVFNSEYRASSGKWYNTKYNSGYAMSFTSGKEFSIRKSDNKKTIGVNAKALYRGGLRNTPIDKEASIAAGETIFNESQPFARKEKDYFRIDVKLSYKNNKTKTTTTWSLDVQNATNAKNVFGEFFDPLTGQTKTSYQAPLIPILSYKIDF